MASDLGKSVMNERARSLWLVFVVGFAFPLASAAEPCGAQPDVGDGERTEPVATEKRRLKDNGDLDPPALRAEVAHFHYDKNAKLLAVQVRLKNVSEQPILLVAEDFAFVTMAPGASAGHHLGVEQEPGVLTLDLSYLKPTAWGASTFRVGAPMVMEMRPQSYRYTTYVFQFPMELDNRYSQNRTVPEPKGPTRIALRFGYASERFQDFYRKNCASEEDTLESKIQTILDKWQETILTEPISVDFGL